jgi:hypothetical protein
MSPPHGPRAGRLWGAPPRTTIRPLLSALIVAGTLLLVRASGGAVSAAAPSDVCVGPVPVNGPCTSTSTTTTESESPTSSTSATATSTTGADTGAATAPAPTGTATSTASTSSRPAPTPLPSNFPAPPPPLPAPQGAPAASGAGVERIVLVPSAVGPIAPGDRVVVQATLEAQRGTDIYAVPHVAVAFALLSAPGAGASLSSSRVDSGDSGVAEVTVRTGDLPGDTVISAAAGSAGSELGLHTVAHGSGPPAALATPLTGAPRPVSGAGDHLATAVVLVVAGSAGTIVLAAVLVGMSRRSPRKRAE